MYYFKNLAPDKMYFVAIDRLPPGFTFSPHIDSIPDSLDTNIILYSNRTECFAIAPNTIDTTIDIGLCRIDTCLLYVEAETYVITCGQDSVQLLPKVNESILNYLWEGPGGFVSAIANPWVSVPGKYYVTVSDDYGCEATACIIVTISNTVDITVTGGSVPCDGNGTYLFVSSENPNASFWWVGPDGFTSREQNPLVQSPGMYWVTVQDTINGCFDKKLVEVLLDCCNVTDGGILSGDETGCGPYDPLPIISVNDPSGGAGDLQYMWIKTNDPSLPFSQWTMIWDGHGSDYDPGLITETTYYSRCSKRAACDEWIGETNVIVKRVIDLPEVVADSVSITSEATCGGDNGEMTIRMTSGTFGPFMVRLVVDGKELVFGPFADRVIVIRGLSPGHYTRVQISNAFACYSVDVDLDLIIHLSNCFDEYSGDQIHIHPNPASTELNLSVKLSPRNQDVQIELVNLVGTVVKRIEKSNNQIKNNEFRERMDVHDIHAGMYYIRIRNGSEVRFIPVEILK
ncbi:MAG: T9SS type A sorting domain-containing protein [Saprospiraceae bacterium]